ncbi:MAG: hypothetical protein ACOY90_20255 [Candidatus Zhuqueibacterota bacterium]
MAERLAAIMSGVCQGRDDPTVVSVGPTGKRRGSGKSMPSKNGISIDWKLGMVLCAMLSG